jgi:hypothetical protein
MVGSREKKHDEPERSSFLRRIRESLRYQTTGVAFRLEKRSIWNRKCFLVNSSPLLQLRGGSRGMYSIHTVPSPRTYTLPISENSPGSPDPSISTRFFVPPRVTYNTHHICICGKRFDYSKEFFVKFLAIF